MSHLHHSKLLSDNSPHEYQLTSPINPNIKCGKSSPISPAKTEGPGEAPASQHRSQGQAPGSERWPLKWTETWGRMNQTWWC